MTGKWDIHHIFTSFIYIMYTSYIPLAQDIIPVATYASGMYDVGMSPHVYRDRHMCMIQLLAVYVAYVAGDPTASWMDIK
jgi:hypothetical protein